MLYHKNKIKVKIKYKNQNFTRIFSFTLHKYDKKHYKKIYIYN